MDFFNRLFCSVSGHIWDRWYKVGEVHVRECRYCNATQKIK